MLLIHTILKLQNLLYLRTMLLDLMKIHCFPQYSLNQIYMTDSSITSNTPKYLYNLQPSSHATKPRVFPSLPHTK